MSRLLRPLIGALGLLALLAGLGWFAIPGVASAQSGRACAYLGGGIEHCEPWMFPNCNDDLDCYKL